MSYLRLFAMVAVCVVTQASVCLAAASDGAERFGEAAPKNDTRARVLTCFNAGSQTVQSMYACSGSWVTPRALVFCLFQSECPVLPDTVAGRQALDASLGRDGRSAPLALDPANLPKFPAAAQIDDCNSKETAPGAFAYCVLGMMAAAPPGLLQCAAIADDKARAGCLIAIAGDPDITPAARCIGHNGGATDFLSCVDNADYVRTLQTAASCLRGSASHPAECLDPDASAADAALLDCVSHAGMTGTEAAKCLDTESPDLSKVHQTARCLVKPNADALKCAMLLAPAPTARVIDCISGTGDPLVRADCAISSVSDLAALIPVRACVAQSLKGPRLADCVAPALDEDDAFKFATCMSSRATAHLDKCLSLLGPNMVEAIRDHICLLKTTGTIKSLACVAARLGGETPKIVACVAGDQGRVLPCLLGGRPDYPLAQQVYACVDGGRGAGGVIENCVGLLIKDDKARRIASCVADSSGDTERWASCAALAALPADTARYVSCAADGADATAFALCALGTAMNEEWRIAAACAVEADGDPVTYGACIAGRLTVHELATCFGVRAGKDCYGPDDVTVQSLRDELRGALAAPGKNPVVQAFNRIAQLTAGGASVVENPSQIASRTSVFHNSAKTFGTTVVGDNAIFHNPQPAKTPAARESVVYQVGHTKLR